jgi:hypothetical protein
MTAVIHAVPTDAGIRRMITLARRDAAALER